MNPTASDAIPPSDFRFPSPASQPAPEVPVNFPKKAEDLGSIYYYPRSARQYLEPQELSVRVQADGTVKIVEKEHGGSPDAPFTPPATSTEVDEALHTDALSLYNADVEKNGHWMKTEDSLPPRPATVQYQWEDVEQDVWLDHKGI